MTEKEHKYVLEMLQKIDNKEAIDVVNLKTIISLFKVDSVYKGTIGVIKKKDIIVKLDERYFCIQYDIYNNEEIINYNQPYEVEPYEKTIIAWRTK